MIDAVIYDMDGLLIDSEPFWQETELRVFNEIGVPLTFELTYETVGLRINEVVDHWYRRFPWTSEQGKEEQKEKIVGWIIDGVIACIREKGTLKPGSHESIDFFRAKNLRIALASSSYYRIIDAVLERFALGPVFEVVHSAEHEPFGKPHPAVYLTTASQLQVQPSACLALEDSLNGVRSAKNAGMTCIAIPEEGLRKRASFTEADLILPSLLDMNENSWETLRTIVDKKQQAAL